MNAFFEKMFWYKHDEGYRRASAIERFKADICCPTAFLIGGLCGFVRGCWNYIKSTGAH